MSIDEGLVDWVTECLEPLGRVTMRRMMGGATLYCDGTVFALVDAGDLYFKGDSTNAADFESASQRKFEFSGKDGKVATMNYWSAPLDVYDDPDAMREWAQLGIAAGESAPKKKRKS